MTSRLWRMTLICFAALLFADGLQATEVDWCRPKLSSFTFAFEQDVAVVELRQPKDGLSCTSLPLYFHYREMQVVVRYRGRSHEIPESCVERTGIDMDHIQLALDKTLGRDILVLRLAPDLMDDPSGTSVVIYIEDGVTCPIPAEIDLLPRPDGGQ